MPSSYQKQTKILLFIPMYNCEKQIIRVLNQLQGEILSFLSEVIIVNNRSTDHGEEAVVDFINHSELPIPIKLLRNCDNYGLGGSHKVAFNFARVHEFDYVVVLHGDDQGEISNLLPILRDNTYCNYDCCLGARFIKGSVLRGYSRFRTFGNKVYNMFFTIALGKRIYDLGSGLNMYKVSILEDNFYHKFPDKLTFNCYMLFAHNRFKHKSMFFPIIWKEDDQVSNVKMFKQARETFCMVVSFLFHKKTYLEREFREKCVVEYSSDLIAEN